MKYALIATCVVVLAGVAFLFFRKDHSKNSHTTHREAYTAYYRQNLNKCVQVMVENQVDSLIAVQKCACFLDNLYAIDSTFVKKSGKELHDFIQANRLRIEAICDSIR